jgi:hypothetical protein
MGGAVKEKIEQLAKGIFKYEQPKILLSEEFIDITVETGSTYQGSFTINNEEGSKMKGVLYSSSRFLCLETDKFIGEKTSIRYHFVADYLTAGEEFKEEISIITDCGEIRIPVTITVEAPYCDTSLGKMKDLFQFANLAMSNWTEAKQVFKSEKFGKIIEYYDKQYLLLYQSLVKSSSISQALDEFLVATHKKVAIEICVKTKDLSYEAGPYNFMDKLVLSKEGWGYTEVRLASSSPYIVLERKMLWSDNFINGQCEVNFVIKTEGMKEGRHSGIIRIETVNQTVNVEVVISCNRNLYLKRQSHLKQKQTTAVMVKNYLNFRFNRISPGKYVSEAESLLLNLLSNDGDRIEFALYQLHLQLITGREGIIQNSFVVLEERQEKLRDTNEVAYGILQYLRTLRKKSNTDSYQACEEIRRLFERNPKNSLLFWCLLYLDKDYENNISKKYQDIKEQYLLGTRSPVIYYEAVNLVFEDTSILKCMDGFEQQLLIFMIKQKQLTKEIATQAAYLIGKEKIYQRLNLRILRVIYEEFKLKEALQGICSLLIRGHQRASKYHIFFEYGVNQQIRVTELPEYYVYTMDEDVYAPLHPSIITYFNFNNQLPEKKKAFYYACLLENAKSNSEVLNQHRKEMLEFLRDQLRLGNQSVHLAVLCDALITKDNLDTELAKLLPSIAFQYILRCPNQKMKSVVVIHKELTIEETVPLVDGKAMVHLVSDSAQVFLVDHSNQRYYLTVTYSLSKSSHLEELFARMFELAPEDVRLVLYLSEKAQNYQKFDEYAIELRKRVALLNELTNEYRKDFIQSLIYYYYDNFEGEILENYLMKIDLRSIDQSNRIKLIEFMIVRDLYNIALKAMSELGFEGVEVRRLLKLCTRLISNANGVFEKIDILVEISYYVFLHGKYDIFLLEYLNQYYYGTTGEMFHLWKASKENNLDTSELEERLLGQMLFAESYMSDAKSVFMSYYRSGANHKLIRAFLSFYAYKFLVKERVVEAEIFEAIKQDLSYEDNEIALQALLKYYSLQEQLTDSEINFIDYHLSVFEQKGILLPFYQDFKKNMRIPQAMYDKYYIEYRTNPKNKVTIHYMIEGEHEEVYIQEEMVDCYYGIFVKEFILFYNESLQYYISEQKEGKEVITESKTITIRTEAQQIEDNNYHRINQIMEATEMKDETTINRLLEAYAKMEYSVSMLFKPIN